MSKINVLIPARGGSKRIPRKNIKLLGGKPLIQWTIESSLSLPVDHVVVSTEDDEIASIADQLGAEVLIRSKTLASDTATDHDVVRHFLKYCPSYFIIYLRPTTPFRESDVSIRVIDAFMARRSKITSLRSVHESPESAFKMFTSNLSGFLNPIRHKGIDMSNMPNQQCPKTYIPNGYIDIINASCESFNVSNVFGDAIYGFVTDPVIELDTEEQWNYAEYLVEKGLV